MGENRFWQLLADCASSSTTSPALKFLSKALAREFKSIPLWNRLSSTATTAFLSDSGIVVGDYHPVFNEEGRNRSPLTSYMRESSGIDSSGRGRNEEGTNEANE